MITPTVGRVVHFYPNNDNSIPGPWTLPGPWKADIVDVHYDRLVNVAVIDPNGEHFAQTSITLVQPGDTPPESGIAYVTWMPYQTRKEHGSESGEQAAGTQEI